MDPVEMYERAIQRTGKVVEQISRDQLDAETPCDDWDVRALLNHVIGGFETLAGGLEGRPSNAMNEPPDYAADDHVVAYRDASEAVLAAFRSPGAMERSIEFPWGETPAQVALGLGLADAVVHGWDLATATGQEAEIDSESGDFLLQMVHGAMQPKGSYPRGGAFKDPVPVSDDAPVGDQLLAYLGRDPG